MGKALDGEGEGVIVAAATGLGGTTTVAGTLEELSDWLTDVPSGRSMVVTFSVTAVLPSMLAQEVSA